MKKLGTLFGLCSSLALCVLRSAGGVPANADDCVRDFAAEYSSAKAYNCLMQLSDSEVVPLLAKALRDDPAYRKDGIRAMTYYILLHKGAARFPTGMDQLLAGLKDSDVAIQRDSATALVLAPGEQHANVVKALAELLEDRGRASEVISAALQTITHLPRYPGGPLLGNPSAPRYPENIRLVVPRVQEILTAAPGDASLRIFAATALLEIVGTDEFLPIAEKVVDLQGRSAALSAITQYGMETEGASQLTPATQQILRSYVSKGLSDPDVELRKAALQAAMAVHGKDLVFEAQGHWQIRPEVETILTGRAQSDPDVTMREQAAGILKSLHEQTAARNAAPPTHGG